MVYSAIENLNDNKKTTKSTANQQQIKSSSKATVLRPEHSSPHLIAHHISDFLPTIMSIGNKTEAAPQKDLGDEVIKMREQFIDQLSKANKNLLRLQNEFGKLHYMSMEFDGLVETFKESNKRPTAWNNNDLKKIKNSIDSMDERIRSIANEQHNLIAMLLKMDLRMKQQCKTDKLNFDAIALALVTVEEKLAQITEETKSTVTTEQFQQHIEIVLNAQSQQIQSTVVVAFILSMIVVYSLFPSAA